MPIGLEDFCDGLGCGWLRPIVRTRLVRVKTPSGGVHVKELRFCKECVAREDKDTARGHNKPLNTANALGMTDDEQI